MNEQRRNSLYPTDKNFYPKEGFDRNSYPFFFTDKSATSVIQGFETDDPVWNEFKTPNTNRSIDQSNTKTVKSGTYSCQFLDSGSGNSNTTLYVESDNSDYSTFETTYYINRNVIGGNTSSKKIATQVWVEESESNVKGQDLNDAIGIEFRSQDTSGTHIIGIRSGSDTIDRSSNFNLNQNQWYKVYMRVQDTGDLRVKINDGNLLDYNTSFNISNYVSSSTGHVRFGMFSGNTPQTEVFYDDIMINKI